jgi:hypothetical protein
MPSQVEITEDQTTPEQLRDAFRAVAKDKVPSTPTSFRALTVPRTLADWYLKWTSTLPN